MNQYTPNNAQETVFRGLEVSDSLQGQEITRRLKKSVQELRRTNELLQMILLLLMQNAREQRGQGAFGLPFHEPLPLNPYPRFKKKKNWFM